MYSKINKCRACDHKKLINLLNLGEQPLANALLKSKKNLEKEIKIPLELCMCNKCKLIQLKHTVDPKILFQKYLWVTGTSKKVKTYRKFFFDELKKNITLKNKFICEIASNDGFFLEYIKKDNKAIGIDPAKNIAKIANSKGIKTHVDFFNLDTAKKIIKIYKKKPNLVICRNVIPHIENIKSVMKGLNEIISKDGIGAIEFHNAKNIIKKKHYDYIYHEHIYYFTLTTINNVLKRNGLFGFDFFQSPISGGSFVILFKKIKTKHTRKFKKMINDENKLKLNSISNWKKLNRICSNHKITLNKIISKYKTIKKIAAYGASARSSTLINYLNLNNKTIRKVFDLNPLKSELYTPGTHIKIQKPIVKNLKQFDVIVLLAWNFKDEILQFLKKIKFKGEVIVPLPKIKIIKLNK
tara:strand:- start:5582 stop:6814 length:1233 start_codon:yes stop_codon:yes gene_type:complete